MLIDWFTVAAQGVNFLILVWLMKRFLYQPILHTIDEREKRIAEELADADTKQADAQKERDSYRQKNEEFEQERAALLNQATEEANAERERLIEQAHTRADILSAKQDETLRSDAQSLNQAISQRAQREVFAIARKALTDLAEASLEERMGDVFIRRLREMDEPTKTRLAEAVRTGPGPALVRSAFELPVSVREPIQRSLNEILSAEVPVRFEVDPVLVGGVELTTNGMKVAWSIAEYLKALERGVGELLPKADKPKPKGDPAKVSERANPTTSPKATGA